MEAVSDLNRLLEYYHENELAHAYLIETNNQERCYSDLINIIKAINCPKIYKNNCEECNLCNLLQNNYLPSFIVIEPDGKNIKKEQILDLKNRFSTVPTYTKENIYIIKEAEKLNSSSANTMLKFIEEPEDHIIGFFLTNNINNVINTIKSRCEIIRNNYHQEENVILDNPYMNIVEQYLINIEQQKSLIENNKKIILSSYNERKDIENIFKLMLEIYQKSIEEKRAPKNQFFLEKFSFLLEKDIEELIKKEQIIVKYLDQINYNVNIELFLDKYVIELSGLNE